MDLYIYHNREEWTVISKFTLGLKHEQKKFQCALFNQ